MIPAPEVTVHHSATWVPVTAEQLEDDARLKAYIEEHFRLADLAERGFLGHVRCARCNRRIRCVVTLLVGDVRRLLSPHCARLEWGFG